MIRRLTLLAASALVAAAPLSAAAQPLRGRGFDLFEGPRAQQMAQARPGGFRDRGFEGDRGERREERLVPLPRVIAQVQRQTPGRLLDAGLEGGARPVYRVRWAADDGRRIDYIVDAATGQILSTE